MAENSARKRRKVYLEGDAYFAVPKSTLYRHEKAHQIASAASRSMSAGTSSQCGSVTPGSPNTPQSGPNDGDGDEVSADDYCSDIPSLDSDESNASDQSQSATPGSPNTVQGGFSDDDVNETYFNENCSDSHCDEQSGDGASDSSDCGYSCDDSDDGSGDGCTQDSSNEDTLPSWFARFGSERLPHSNVSKAGAIAAVMSFAVSHGLTWTAMGDLAKLINFLLGTNALPQSKYLFRKLWSRDVRDVVQRHFYCEPCKCVMIKHDSTAECGRCHIVRGTQVLKDEGCFFIILNLATQLGITIDRTKADLHESLQKLQEPSLTISDITRGSCYTKLKEEQNLHPDDITLTLNTDGSPVWKSSKTSVWPLQFIINELPPHLRFRHPVLAGLWFGRKHPDMQLFLNEFVTEVNSMVGVKWNHNGDTHISRPHVLCISVDAPARAAVQNMVSFNGYFGCTWCLNPGEHREGSLRYTVVSPIMMRTSDQVKSEMRLASQFKDTINGLKGPSALMNLKGLDLVNGYSVEYMHCVLLGVAKQITETILATSNSHQRFYSGSPSALSQIDARLLSIKPPHCITRLPRSIQERSYWKASEWRHWLLFYSLPCLSGILIEEYWRHLSKLSGGVYILLKDELTAQEIDKAEFLLKKFVSRCEALYGASFMTYNVHALLHLASCARSLGPLWAHAAFVFEGGNGTIVRQILAAKGLPDQIMERVVMYQQLQRVLESPALPSEEKSLCNHFFAYSPVQKFLCVDGVSLLGIGKNTVLTVEEQEAVNCRCRVATSTAVEYERFVKEKQIFHSTGFRKPSKSDTTFVRIDVGNYARIEKIIVLKETGSCVVICRPVIIADVRAIPPYLKECFLSCDGTRNAFLPDEIVDSCLCIDFVQEDKMFICDLPNKIERD